MYEAYNNMDQEGQERFLNRLVKENMCDKIKELDMKSINIWLEDKPDVKQKYREFKLNKIID